MTQANGQRVAANGTRRLAEAVRAAKIASAQRTDVVIDIREADRARLEIFADELQPIAEAVPGDDDLFDFMLAGGSQPRFWIDGTAHVMMARDRRTYRFVRETRIGRVTLAESAEVRVIVDHVTDYVAERMVERDRAYALDDRMAERLAERAASRDGEDEPLRSAFPERPTPSRVTLAASALLAGIVVGAGCLLAFAALRGVPLV